MSNDYCQRWASRTQSSGGYDMTEKQNLAKVDALITEGELSKVDIIY